jgi:hypothetical protein
MANPVKLQARAPAILLAATLLSANCFMAPSRVSRIKEGFDFEVTGGPTVFEGWNIVDDTSYFLGFTIEPSRDAGAFGQVRVGYGYNDRIGADLSLGLYYGWDLARKFGAAGCWQPALAIKARPWTTNHLLFLE